MFIQFLVIPLTQALWARWVAHCLLPLDSGLPGEWEQVCFRTQSILNPEREMNSEQSTPQQHPAVCVGGRGAGILSGASGILNYSTYQDGCF